MTFEFDEDYFVNRNLNDKKRLLSFQSEHLFIEENGVDVGGIVCDVGCSTGEFLSFLNWTGPKYGMEVSEFAAEAAKGKGVCFDKNIVTEKEFFDVIIMRGVFQHLDDPINYIKLAHTSLKNKGVLLLLATPNIESVVFRTAKDLPALDLERNLLLPSFSLVNHLTAQLGFSLVGHRFPYRKSGYDELFNDIFKMTLLKLGLRKKIDFAWPGNMMDLIYQKNG